MDKFLVDDQKALKELYSDCLQAMKKSYSPYSKTAVGACIWTKDGKKIYGANIENASYGLTVCAERTAMFSAHLDGVKKEDQIVLGIAADFTGYAYPCGACRQVMAELLPFSCPVVMFDPKGNYKIINVGEIMPGIFTKDDLKNL
ncbi:MAG: cytidine deaminase [Bacilli bacterium]|jgi:cytidine deaminase|nr:cytidine deaminase [Bacilli bacterium]